MKKIVLASGSPRRCELLKSIGLDFVVQPDCTQEPRLENMSPCDTVLYLSEFKGKNVLGALNEDAVVIAADTIVCIGGKILGKPKNKAEAFEMLSCLSGKMHEVYTGVYIAEKNGEKSAKFYEKTQVYFKKLDICEINDYISTMEPMDKAGGYGIQEMGSLFVEKICGDYFNVVGLPLCRLGKVLKDEFGVVFFKNNMKEEF